MEVENGKANEKDPENAEDPRKMPNLKMATTTY